MTPEAAFIMYGIGSVAFAFAFYLVLFTIKEFRS